MFTVIVISMCPYFLILILSLSSILCAEHFVRAVIEMNTRKRAKGKRLLSLL